MKNLNGKYLLTLAVMFALSLSVFAYTADIAGKYTGSADIEGAGTLAITAEIIVKDDKISGSINSDAGTVAITGGTYADDKVTLTLDAGGDAATMSGTVSEDGKITGDVSGAFRGTFQMTRDKSTH